MSEVHISSHFNTLPRHGYQRLNRHRILTTWDCWHCLRNLLFIVVLTLIGYKFIYWPSPKNCITFPLLRNDESDQLLEICAGLSIAMKTGRIFYISNKSRSEKASQAIEKLGRWFPELGKKIKFSLEQTSPFYVPYTEAIKAHLGQLAHKGECILLDSEYSYNAELFYDYYLELRDILKFSYDVSSRGDELLEESEVKNRYMALCVHVGRGTIVDTELDPSMHEIVKAAREISIKTNLNEFYIFSDDMKFASSLEYLLHVNKNWQPHVHVTKNSEVLDLYIARQVCGAVLLTSHRSTLGWWLGFLASMPSKVFYMRSAYENGFGVQMFLPSWIPYTEWKTNNKSMGVTKS